MKIFKTSEISKIDRYTIEHEPISSVNLMERAAKAVFHWFTRKYDNYKGVSIFCGNGNNGGDGLALARMLIDAGYHVVTFILNNAERLSPDAALNYEKLRGMEKAEIISLSDNLPDIPKNNIIIDALFGSGLNRPLDGFNLELVQHINQSNCPVISIDMPSGLFGEDNSTNNRNGIIHATHTLSLEMPKLAFLLPENEFETGNWHLLPIGLHPYALQNFTSNYYYTEEDDTAKLLKHRSKFSHKGTFGKALLIAGSYGMMGAAVLAAKACYRTGCGWLCTHVPKYGVDMIQNSVPESVLNIDGDKHFFTTFPANLNQYDAIGIGCGIGQTIETQNAFANFVNIIEKPVVVDADALNILSKHPEMVKKLPPDSIITPHRKEFERLTGKWHGDYDCLVKQIEFAVDNHIIVVLKGAYTSVALPNGEVYFNSTGNAGMATAGSGDVLTGIILSLMAQKYSTDIAARLGVYLHGLAGDIAQTKWGDEALMASDITACIGMAFQQLKGYN